MITALLLQDPMIEGEPVPLWWLWILIAVGAVGVIIYLVSHIRPGGGPWADH